MKRKIFMNNNIKRIICLCLVVLMFTAFTGCKKNPAYANSSLSEETEYVYIDSPSSEEQTSSEKTEPQEEVSSKESSSSSSSNNSGSTETSSVGTVDTDENAETVGVPVDKVKTITVQGETISANFIGRRKRANSNFHARNLYHNSDGVTLEYDSVTGELARMEKNLSPFNQDEETIELEEAVEIAEEFIKTHTDLDLKEYIQTKYEGKYQQTQINHERNIEIKSYYICYSRFSNGYANRITVKVREDGQLYWFFVTPNVYDETKKEPIDEQILLKKLDEQIQNHFGDKKEYKVLNQGISADSDNDMIMCYDVEVEHVSYIVCLCHEFKREKVIQIERMSFDIKI